MRIQDIEIILEQDKQLSKDQLLCRVMACWAELAELTKSAIRANADQETRKAIFIARTALELASEQLTETRHAVPIRRV